MDKLKKIIKFMGIILIKMLGVAIITYLSFCFAKYVKADAANAAAIVVGIVSTVLSGIGTISDDFKKIFKNSEEK